MIAKNHFSAVVHSSVGVPTIVFSTIPCEFGCFSPSVMQCVHNFHLRHATTRERKLKKKEMKRSIEEVVQRNVPAKPVKKAGTTALDKVVNAIRNLKSPTGSSTKAIVSFILKEEGGVNENAIKKVVLTCL